MTGGTGLASKKQVTNAGSQFGNAWVEHSGDSKGWGGASGKIKRNESVNASNAGAVANGSTSGGAYARGNPRGASCTLCGAWRGELGSEPTPALFVAHLVEVMRECKRVLRDDGVLFLNIADSMAGSGKGPTGKNGLGDQTKRQGFHDQLSGGKPKSLQLVPERLAIALSDDGWIVRQVLIWAKNNPMPESVRDRWTTAHEYVLMLVKQPRYFFDQEAIREPYAPASLDRFAYAVQDHRSGTVNGTAARDAGAKSVKGSEAVLREDIQANPAGRNGRSVWTINTTGYPGAHYAVFSPEIPRRCILAATSEYGACAACGAPYRRLTERTTIPLQATYNGAQINNSDAAPPGSATRWSGGTGKPSRVDVQHTGWTASCRCGPAAGVRPCIVLDPFAGSFTTPYVAASLGRIGIGVELSQSYIEQARYGRLAQEFLPLVTPA
jgi:DNA modification methylase